MSDSDYNILINAMEEMEVEPQAMVIKEGEPGEEVYILDEGELECFKNDSYNGDETTIMKDIK